MGENNRSVALSTSFRRRKPELARTDLHRIMEAPEKMHMENNRGYHEFRRGAYMYPCDPVRLCP